MNGKQVGTGMVSQEDLILGDVPWTKSEVRAVSLAQLDLLPHHHVLEVGAGSGTVTIEIARRLKEGKVVAIEQMKKGCQLIKANLAKFGIENVDLIYGKAPEVIPDKRWDRIFVGGSGGRLEEILDYAYSHLKPSGRLVLNTVTLDSLQVIHTFFQKRQLSLEIVLLQISRLSQIGRYSMYQGENPIHVITFVNKVT